MSPVGVHNFSCVLSLTRCTTKVVNSNLGNQLKRGNFAIVLHSRRLLCGKYQVIFIGKRTRQLSDTATQLGFVVATALATPRRMTGLLPCFLITTRYKKSLETLGWAIITPLWRKSLCRLRIRDIPSRRVSPGKKFRALFRVQYRLSQDHRSSHMRRIHTCP